jgi:radical SAM protein with 4Fe4S-binding SPASM domain
MTFLRKTIIVASKFLSRQDNKDIYQKDFESSAKEYDAAVTRKLLGKFTEDILNELELKPGMRCVDLGCGTGHATEIINSRINFSGLVVGYDIAESMLDIARQKLKNSSSAKFVNKDMLVALREQEANSVNLVTAFWALGYSEPNKVLREIGRVLASDGQVAILVNTQESLSELQKLVSKILIHHPSVLKYIPPVNFPSGIRSFRAMADKAGLSIKCLREESCVQAFDTGEALISWMKTSGPCAGFRGALKENRRDYSGGIKLTFRFLYFVGSKAVSKRNNNAGKKSQLKAKIMINCQNLLLKTFGKAKPGSRLWSIIQKFSKGFVGGYPYVIKLDVIDRCNLNCKMCYARNSGSEVPLKNILHILRQFDRVPIRLDLLGGEPLLRDDICEIVRYAKSNTAIQEIVLYTNGTLATEGLAKNLCNAGLDKAIVTLVFHIPDRHDDFTKVSGSWHKTLYGIGNFVKAGIKTYTFTALHAENIQYYNNIYSFVTSQLKITPLFYQYIPQKSNDPLSTPLDLWNEAKHKVLCEYRPHHLDYIKEILTFCGRLCLGGYYSLSIKTDGTVTPCPFMYDVPLGNALTENIWDIFAKRFDSQEFSEFMQLPEECGNCSYKNFCGGGCKAGNKILFGSYAKKDCRCQGPWQETMSSKELPNKIPSFF